MVLNKKIMVIPLFLLLLSFFVLAENTSVNETNQCVNKGGVWVYEINNSLGGYCDYKELEAAISLCFQREGEPVSINGKLFCREGETYKPLFNLLEKEEVVTIFGMKMPDLGAMVFKSNPGFGWIIIFGMVVAIMIIYNDQRVINVERGVKRAKKKRIEKKDKELSEPEQGKRRRSDGGFY